MLSRDLCVSLCFASLLALGVACGDDDGDPSRDAGGEDGGVEGRDAGSARDAGPRPDTGPGPACGDGARDPGEGCDDGAREPGDGCDADCAVEEGWVCPVGEACRELVVCGDGVVGEGEGCDDRNDAPGDGCDADCQVEAGWACPLEGVACRAAECGDGIVAGFEECEDDDAPPTDGDGCSSSCTLEDGWVCRTAGEACERTVCGDGVVEGTEQCDDMNNDTGDGCTPFCEVEPMCVDGTCTSACGDGVVLPGEPCDDGNRRSGDGCSADCEVEEGFACELTRLDDPPFLELPIVYRDFVGSDREGGHPDFQYRTGAEDGIVAEMLGADGLPVYAPGDAGSTSTTNGREWFDLWYRDTDRADVVQLTVVDRIRLERTGEGVYVFDDGDFFPLDGSCPRSGADLCGLTGMDMEPRRTGGHNFHFTSVVRYWFEYEGDEVLSFRGDDDVWVFINGRLAIDLGGVHGPLSDSITLDAAEAAELGLRVGGIYEVVVFQAERHTTQSSYRLTLSNFTSSRTSCEPVCGDGIVTRFEACDDGVNDGRYGGCLPGCLERGPRCGDGELQEDEGEQCDDGLNLGEYGGCNPDCTLGPRCGDGERQDPEECDDGNDDDGDACGNDCTSNII